jgi:hypothetical protein
MDVHVQINQIISVPQQYADLITVDLADVDVVFPPTPPPPPSNSYITEEGDVFYVTESGKQYYIQE